MLLTNPAVVIIEYWNLDCGDLGINKVTTKQLNGIMQADSSNTRFVKINDLVINTAFIRGAKKVIKRYSEQDLRYKTIDKADIPFITYDARKKELKETKKFYLEGDKKVYLN